MACLVLVLPNVSQQRYRAFSDRVDKVITENAHGATPTFAFPTSMNVQNHIPR
jgi:hypothetical protein